MGCIFSSQQLLRATDAERFSFDRRSVMAKCIKVYDGDSITVLFKHDGRIRKFSVRMLGYDTPEIRKPAERKDAIIARDHLSRMIKDKIIRLECGKYDKYGRILAVVFLGNLNINNEMLPFGHAYHGGKKQLFS